MTKYDRKVQKRKEEKEKEKKEERISTDSRDRIPSLLWYAW